MSMRRKNLAMLATTAAVLLTGTIAQAGKFNRTVEVGQPAPGFENLIGIDDKQHGLDEYAEAKAVVLVFTCNHCPVAVAYEDRLVRFTRDCRDKGVEVVAVNVNNDPVDRLDQMKLRAEEKGFNFPYLYDPTQQIAGDYGATCTPHVFVLDGHRKIAYMGAIDDNQDESLVTKHYLREAVDAVVAGRKPEVGETRQFGCSITYE